VKRFSIVEAEISDLRNALDKGWTSSVDLVARYLRRIAVYDRRGKLNSIPNLNQSVFEDAAASDDRRAHSAPIRPLEGIPFTVKDSYKVKGMTVASGSPAFERLIASDDAFTVKLLRDAGAVLIGRTNMSPMAAGGMQRGVYGRAESPYNPEYLTAAFASGSSNGSATSTAASFAAFGMAEETVSSGRSPASNNGLAAYTPSRGLISIRGNWPLYPTCDVVVPHARTMRDMLEILDIIVTKNDVTAGDFWRDQPFVSFPDPSKIRPSSFKSLANPVSLKGKRIGVPKMYIGRPEGLACGIQPRQSVLDLWARAKDTLESLGAVVTETAFPLMDKHDTVSASFRAQLDRADATPEHEEPNDGLTKAWNIIERRELVAYAWDDFLTQNNDPAVPSLAAVDGALIFPRPSGALPDRYVRLGAPIPYSTLVPLVTSGHRPIAELPGLEPALKALEARRKADFEDWLDAEGLDFVVFPAAADVGRADSDKNEASADDAWRNGVLYSNGNRVLRHYGVPSVTVAMGVMADIGMPVGLTFAGKAYADAGLLEAAFTFEEEGRGRRAPEGTPVLEGDFITEEVKTAPGSGGARPVVTVERNIWAVGSGKTVLRLSGALEAESVTVSVDGMAVSVIVQDGKWTAEMELSREPIPSGAEIDKTLVVVLAVGENGRSSGKLVLLD
jgi:amidase